MTEDIIQVNISNDLDIALAHRLMIELSGLAGLTISDQTRLATAVSEICRNAIEYADGARLTYSISDVYGGLSIASQVKDCGPGIPEKDMVFILQGAKIPKKNNNRGTGLSHSRKLVDIMEVITDKSGTCIQLAQKLPARSQKISPQTISDWKEHFKERQPISPYEEIKFRNNQLLDLTEELRANNEELRLANNRAKESAESFLSISDNISQIILKADNALYLTYVNKHWCNFTGLSAKDSLGNDWECAIHPADLESLLAAKKKALTLRSSFESEIRLQREDKAYVWHYCKGEAIHDTDNVVAMWIITGTDIDEKKRFADKLEKEIGKRTEELSRANLELLRSNAELEQFAYVASHDLNEPIRMVSNFTSLLSARYQDKLTPEADEFLKFIKEGAERMEQLVKDLLEFSRIGRLDSRFAIVDCDKTIERVKENLYDLIEKTGAIITADKLPEINAMPSLIVRLFQNLIQNAIKFHSVATPTIHIRAEKKGGNWEFAVKDNGIGIDAVFFERIFVMFQRLHSRENYPGTGIGLAICRKIVEYQGGEIWVSSVLGEGSTFYFTIPIPSAI